VWRSRGLYPNDGAGVAFGPHAFAFASFRRGVFVTDLRSPERLVVGGRGHYPYEFTRDGRLVVTSGRAITVVSPGGEAVRGYAYRARNGITFDAESERNRAFASPTPGSASRATASASRSA